VLLIQGCAKPILHPLQSEQADPLVPAGTLDFGWKLSGNRTVAPLQVFSDAQRTWLHWHPGQSLPVIVAIGPQGEQVLAYRRQNPYTVIDGHWPQLSFRAGRHQAFARRLSAQSKDAATAHRMEPESTHPLIPAVQEQAAAPVKTHAPVYAVTPEDQHLRRALLRWSGLSGWRFQPEHWGVDVDIPLSAGASFTDDFVSSVQALVAATELSDRPLQPCFYTNQVLRIVSASEPCDRTLAPGASV
jgi:hypothetical protein